MRMDKLLSYVNSLTPADQALFATRCGTTIGYIRKAISKKQKFSGALCINIERESCKCVTCEDLDPDTDWAFIRSSKAA